MNNISGGQLSRSGQYSFSRRQSVRIPVLSDIFAFRKYSRTAGFMYGPVDSAAAEEAGVRGIDNSIDFKAGYIALDNFKTVGNKVLHFILRPNIIRAVS
jgi:hypothetical protein